MGVRASHNWSNLNSEGPLRAKPFPSGHYCQKASSSISESENAVAHCEHAAAQHEFLFQDLGVGQPKTERG
jgi:hypothetical protein